MKTLLNIRRWSGTGYLSFGGKNSCTRIYGESYCLYHRYDDNETKWIVVPCDDEGKVPVDIEIPTDNEIYAQIAFQEQFFCGVLVK